jgi:hypothetical protein
MCLNCFDSHADHKVLHNVIKHHVAEFFLRSLQSLRWPKLKSWSPNFALIPPLISMDSAYSLIPYYLRQILILSSNLLLVFQEIVCFPIFILKFDAVRNMQFSLSHAWHICPSFNTNSITIRPAEMCLIKKNIYSFQSE